jgi:hypothetical protein
LLSGLWSAAGGEITVWAGIVVIVCVIVVCGPKYITAWAELIKARRTGRGQSNNH